MSTLLCPPIPKNYVAASEFESFFSTGEINRLFPLESREQPKIKDPKASCNTNLFFGFFFDGTGNNYELAEKTGSQSNVARLYDIFPGRGVPKVLDGVTWKYRPERYNHFFRVYIPGVGTPFDQVNDTGRGWMETLGGGIGFKGGDRIVWALVQAVNNVHRYFYGRPLVSAEEATTLATTTPLSSETRQNMTLKVIPEVKNKDEYKIVARVEFERILRRLHASVSKHWSNGDAPPANINPAIVKKIYISIFGFSRGATQSRAFANWLDSLCRLDAMIRGEGTRSLGGFPVEFDFLGIFDTVASIGISNAVGNIPGLSGIDGHGAWADAEDSLRIPTSIKQCVHLVAGHELRRSFPCDSISVGSALPAGASEIVFPGVHSDIGGGYAPRQQGKGLDPSGADMLSRLPLLLMYKEARLAGVPLKLELADQIAKEKFKVSEKTIDDFNAYLAKCTKRNGSLTDIIRGQAILQMSWRYYRREGGPTPLHRIASYGRATAYDKGDLVSANREYNEELRDFEKSIIKRGKVKPKPQKAGFDDEVSSEWEEVARYWPFAKPDQVVMHFFDEYVHDSRSGFKPLGEKTEAEALEALKKWSNELKVAKLRYKESQNHFTIWSRPGPPDYGLKPNKRIAAEAYDRIKTIPVYINEGREPYAFAEAGYFRFRKIYAGSDSVLLSNWMPEDVDRSKALASAEGPSHVNSDEPVVKTDSV